MKFILGLTIIILLTNLQIIVSKSSHDEEEIETIVTTVTTQIIEDEKNCGCIIIDAYFNKGKGKKQKKYKPRWKKASQPVKNKPELIECEENDGDILLDSLRKFFKSKKLPKEQAEETNNQDKKPKQLLKPTGKYTLKIFNLAREFKRLLNDDKKKYAEYLKKVPSKNTDRKLLLKNTLSDRMGKARYKCNNKLISYLNPLFQSPYKNTSRCTLIGHSLLSCFGYIQ